MASIYFLVTCSVDWLLLLVLSLAALVRRRVASRCVLPQTPPGPSNMGSPDGSASDLDAMGRIHIALLVPSKTMDDLFAAIAGIQQWMTHNALGLIDKRFSRLEQEIRHASRSPQLAAAPLSAPMGVPPLVPVTLVRAVRTGKGKSDRKLTQRHGPNHPRMNISSSAILFHFPCAQNLAGVTAWCKQIAEENDEIRCKSGSFSARFVCSTESICQHIVVRQKDTSFRYAVDGVFSHHRYQTFKI